MRSPETGTSVMSPYSSAVRSTPADARGFRLALLGFLPLFVWWLGWFPGFLSSDSIDQLTQVDTGEINNFHPATHTIAMWLITRLWDSPGAISLVQIAVFTVVVSLIARRLIQLGVPLWLSVGSVWTVTLLPAVAPMTLSIWKDVPFTLGFLWVMAELLLLARLRESYWDGWHNAARLGAAFAVMWLFRHNGLLTVVILGVGIGWIYRDLWRRTRIALGVLIVVLVVVQGPVFWLFSVDTADPAAAELLIGDVAASLVHEPGNFSADELAYLETIAPLDVWRELYDCDNANRILFDGRFDKLNIRNDPGPFMRLAARTIVRDLDTVLGHRWCTASYLLVPAQPESSYLQRPPFEIFENDLGINREPVVDAAFDITLDVFQFAEPSGRLWLTWRPALVVWLTVATYAALAWRRHRQLLWPGLLIAAHVFNVAATSLSHQFRLAFPIYVAGLLSLPLLWFLYRPSDLQSPSVLGIADRGALEDPHAAPTGLGGVESRGSQ